MVVLFTGMHDSQSRGPKPVSASVFFNKLVPRLTNMLTAANSDGRIAEVDTRLRPSGAKGLLAVSVDSFAAYQQKEAWVWEHMALTRARHVAGPETETRKVLSDVFAATPDRKRILADILEMRQDMDTHRTQRSDWDMKLAPGGLVDIEFILHALQLQHACRHPEIIQPVLEDAIAALVAASCLTTAQGKLLLDALTLQHALRTLLSLCEAGDATETISKPVANLVCRVTGHKTLPTLTKNIQKTRAGVLEIWHATFGEPRKIEETSDGN
jgi:[glutamine synthetase] adenylyltransferase / [glutamine synthetase]-adenylyl-L-tyrosine phosphorylase